MQELFWTLYSYFLAAMSAMANNAHELLLALIGTFVGAYGAFVLERKARVAEQRRVRATEGNLALLTLFQMFNVLRQYQKEVTELAGDKEGRWMRLKVTFPQPDEKIGFDPSRLAFLFEGDNKNLLPEILLEERRYHLVVSMINRRSHLMLERIYPILAKNNIQHGQNLPETALKGMIGPALAAEADQLSESIVINVNENVESLVKTSGELRKQLVALLPKERFIRVEFEWPKQNGVTAAISTGKAPLP